MVTAEADLPSRVRFRCWVVQGLAQILTINLPDLNGSTKAEEYSVL